MKAYLTLALILVFTNFASGVSALVQSQQDDTETKRIEDLKRTIVRIGVGKKAKVKVRLMDGTNLKGLLSDIEDDHFVITDAKTGTAIVVPYRNTKSVKRTTLSKGTSTAIGVALGVALIVGVLFLLGNAAKKVD